MFIDKLPENKSIDINLPFSKSYVIRIAIIAFLSNNLTFLEYISKLENLSDDIKAILRCIYACIIGDIAYCGESATCLRLFSFVSSLFIDNNNISIAMEGTLQTRLVDELQDILEKVHIKNSIKIENKSSFIKKNNSLHNSFRNHSNKYLFYLQKQLLDNEFQILNNSSDKFKYFREIYNSNNMNHYKSDTITKLNLFSKIKPGNYTINGKNTSIFISGLLMSLPLCEGNSILEVIELNSAGYVDLTIDILKTFGVFINRKNNTFYIEGKQKYISKEYIELERDWSAAANLLVLGAIRGNCFVKGLKLTSKQPDKIIYDFLESININIRYNEEHITVHKSSIPAFSFDATNYPDIIPPLVVLALNSLGKCYIYGVSRIIVKESNRLEAIICEFNKLGANIIYEEKNNRFVIMPSILKSNKVSSNNDHRIAMALAIAGLTIDGGIEIDNIDCITKSYPDFFNIF